MRLETEPYKWRQRKIVNCFIRCRFSDLAVPTWKTSNTGKLSIKISILIFHYSTLQTSFVCLPRWKQQLCKKNNNSSVINLTALSKWMNKHVTSQKKNNIPEVQRGIYFFKELRLWMQIKDCRIGKAYRSNEKAHFICLSSDWSNSLQVVMAWKTLP